MSNPAKALFSMFLLLIVLAYVVFSSDINLVDTKKENYNDAIQAASQVATMDIMATQDVNVSYDGIQRDQQDITINFDALDTFRNTLYRLLENQRSGRLEGVSNINIPLAGFVTYDYIIGVTYGEAYADANTLSNLGYTYEEYLELPASERSDLDEQLNNLRGAYLLPMGYTYYYQSNGNAINGSTSGGEYTLDPLDNRLWRFTLGDSIFIPTGTISASYTSGSYTGLDENRYIIGGTGTNEGKLIYKADSQGMPLDGQDGRDTVYYDCGLWLASIGFNTMYEFRDFIVMSSINQYLNGHSGAAFNETAGNTDTALDIQLSLADFSDSFENYTDRSSVIQGPGMFAIIDIYTGSNNTYQLYERVASFGGSELVPVTLDDQ